MAKLNQQQKDNQRQLIEDFINNENIKTLSKASIMLGISRRSLGRYRDGEKFIPERIKERIIENQYSNFVSDVLQIPRELPQKPMEDGEVIYVNANMNLKHDIGLFENSMAYFPLKTLAKSIENQSNDNDGYLIVLGEDGCACLINKKEIKKLTIEYKNESDPDVVFYRANQMSFNDTNCAFVQMNESRMADYYNEIDDDKIIELATSGNFFGESKEDILFIVLDKESSKLFFEKYKEIELAKKNTKINKIELS